MTSRQRTSVVEPPLTPPPTSDQLTPSQRAMRLAGLKSTAVKRPPTYSAGPPPAPSSNTASVSSATVDVLVKLPTTDQARPSQRASCPVLSEPPKSALPVA